MIRTQTRRRASLETDALEPIGWQPSASTMYTSTLVPAVDSENTLARQQQPGLGEEVLSITDPMAVGLRGLWVFNQGIGQATRNLVTGQPLAFPFARADPPLPFPTSWPDTPTLSWAPSVMGWAAKNDFGEQLGTGFKTDVPADIWSGSKPRMFHVVFKLDPNADLATYLGGCGWSGNLNFRPGDFSVSAELINGAPVLTVYWGGHTIDGTDYYLYMGSLGLLIGQWNILTVILPEEGLIGLQCQVVLNGKLKTNINLSSFVQNGPFLAPALWPEVDTISEPGIADRVTLFSSPVYYLWGILAGQPLTQIQAVPIGEFQMAAAWDRAYDVKTVEQYHGDLFRLIRRPPWVPVEPGAMPGPLVDVDLADALGASVGLAELSPHTAGAATAASGTTGVAEARTHTVEALDALADTTNAADQIK